MVQKIDKIQKKQTQSSCPQTESYVIIDNNHVHVYACLRTKKDIHGDWIKEEVIE